MSMDHVCITVRDVDKSIDFYSRGLGLKLLRVSVLRPRPKTEFKNAYMYSDQFLLELLTAKPAVIRSRTPDTWEKTLQGSLGITHLGMRVHNLDEAVKRVKAAGGHMIDEPIQVARKTTNFAYVSNKVDPKIRYAKKPGKKPWRNAIFSDPDGIIIELVER